MFELKRLSPEGIEAALAKAERYRLLNEPWHAESICRDILEIERDNQRALVMLVLALTDQFGTTASSALFNEARKYVARLEGEYERLYYEGIVCERRGKAHFERRQPGSGRLAHEWYEKAMEWFAQAEALQPPGVEDAKLRWNTCARMLMKHESIQAPEPDTTPQLLE
jgi:tetratricopeptide (TPR) repeat protein